MTDKVQKIREEIEIVINRRLNLLNGDQFDLNKEVDGFTNEIMDIIDSLQEEPVSIWHNMDEIPIKGEVIVVQTKDTFYGISVQKGGTTYKNRNKDRYVRWAYASDLLNLSNVQRTTKDWKEPDKWKPQTGDTFRKKGTTSPTYHLCDKREDGITFGFVENREVGIAGGEITIFTLQQDYELVERLKSIEDVVEEEFNRALQTKVEQKTKDESCLKDLGEYINELSKQFPEVSFAKLSRIAVRVAKWQKEKEYTCYEEAFEDGAKWKVENLWKPADGDDLPEIDREVIALLDNGKVVFAHRPNPEGWDAVSIITEKVEHYIPETYGKGGWNIPNVKWWLDCLLPNMEEE